MWRKYTQKDRTIFALEQLKQVHFSLDTVQCCKHTRISLYRCVFLEILSLTHILWGVSRLITLFLYFEIIFSQGDLMTLGFLFQYGLCSASGTFSPRSKCKCHVWQISLRSKIFINTSAMPWIRLGIKTSTDNRNQCQKWDACCTLYSSQLEFWSQ